MALTYENCFAHIRHALESDSTASEVSMKSIVDEAGEYLMALHKWKWAEARQAFLTGLGNITGGTATWTQATKTVTDAGKFASYTFYEGDKFVVQAGTGLAIGTYLITARVDANSITIDTSIGPDASDLSYRIERDRIPLPDDFQEMIAITGEESFLNRVRMVGYRELMEYRTDGINVTGAWTFYGAILHTRKDNILTGPIVRLLEIWPQFSDDSASIFTMLYRRGWQRSNDDTFELFVPSWMEGIFIQIVRAMALGYEEHDEMGRSERLARSIEASLELERLKAMDGSVQETYGPINGTALQSTESAYPHPYVTTALPGPS